MCTVLKAQAIPLGVRLGFLCYCLDYYHCGYPVNVRGIVRTAIRQEAWVSSTEGVLRIESCLGAPDWELNDIGSRSSSLGSVSSSRSRLGGLADLRERFIGSSSSSSGSVSSSRSRPGGLAEGVQDRALDPPAVLPVP